MKNNGQRLVPLEVSEVKQIAGRAGRYRTAHQAVTEDESQNKVKASSSGVAVGLDDTKPKPKPAKFDDSTIGYATTLEAMDLKYLQSCMRNEAPPIKTAGLFPPSLVVERFASYFPPGTPFSYIMLRLNEISEINPRFHLCALRDQLKIADAIHAVRNLSVQDRIEIGRAHV